MVCEHVNGPEKKQQKGVLEVRMVGFCKVQAGGV